MSASQTFDLVYAVASPICYAAVCIGALVRKAERARWVVPLLLGLFLTSVALRPHVAALSAVGIGAGVIAIFAAIFDRRSVAIAGTLLCCAGIGLSLFMGLTRG